MSITVSTKSALKSSTSNVALDTLPKDYKAEADKAIDENARGGVLLLNAEQRMAYAVMVYCTLLHVNSTTAFTLADVLKTDTSKSGAKAFFMEKCKAEFVPAIPALSKDANDKQRDEWRNKNSAASKANTMFNRAFNLAALFAHNGVTYLQFNKRTGNFSVAPALLMQSDGKPCTPQGRLATSELVALDGRSIAFLGHNTKGEEKTWNANASLLHFKLMNKVATAPRTRTPRADATSDLVTYLKDVSPEVLANNVDFAKAVYVVYRQFCKDADGALSSRGDYTAKVWEMLSNISKRTRDSQAAPSWESEPPMSEPKTKRIAKKAA